LISFINSAPITILGTTNVRGKTEPCGWPANPRGGLARKATIVDKFYDENITPIILDAGNLLFWDDYVDPGIALDIAKVDANVIIDSYNIVGCDAFAPGSKDFAAGKNFLLELEKKSNFDFISCNIVHNSNNKLLFKPYKIINNNNKRIVIIGLASKFESKIIIEDPGESSFKDGEMVDLKNIKIINQELESLNKIPAKYSEEINFIDPILALKNNINEVKNKSDLIILLFNGTEKDLQNIYKEKIIVDFIIKSGKHRVHDKNPSKDGGQFIPTFSCGQEGKIVYKFELSQLDSDYPIVDKEWCYNEIETVNGLLDGMKHGDMTLNLLEYFKDDPTNSAKVKRRLSRIERANYLLNNSINTIAYEKIYLSDSVVDKTKIANLVLTATVKKEELEGALEGPQLEEHNKKEKHNHPHDHDGDGYPDH